MGNDPPGQFTRVLHPRHGRHGTPPPEVIPIGRSVIVPANGTLPNIILSPRSVLRIKHALERERFDVLHLHEPMTPTPCIATLAMSTAPMVGTFHANGDLGWMRFAKPMWGFLAERLDHRIAVSERARESADRWLPGDYEIVPNGVLIPPRRRARGQAEPRRLRRPARGAQRTARPPARLARDPRAHRRDAANLRRRPARRPPSDDTASHPRGRRRGARLRAAGGVHGRSCSPQKRWSRPRSAARASGSCSSARWPAQLRWLLPTSLGTVTS